MIVGVLKEIKSEENRVSLTPAGVEMLREQGEAVLVESQAGVGSGFADTMYVEAGAEIVASAAEIYGRAELVLHVKEPQPQEYPLIRRGQVLFTYFHFAANETLTRAMLERGAVCIAYETVEDAGGGLPLLTPMSEIAGRMAAQQGATCLERSRGGRGLLIGGVPGVVPAHVVVIGGGTVGRNAALMACGLGARVTLLDRNLARLRQLSTMMPKNCTPLFSSPATLRELLPSADVVIGAVLVPGAKAPHLIDRSMLSLLPQGAVLVDVAIDQGGCFATSHPTTHGDPTYIVDEIVHYCVANMPGAVPLTSTQALTNATLPYLLTLAKQGWKEAARADVGLQRGINMVEGQLTCAAVGEAFDIATVPLEPLFSI